MIKMDSRQFAIPASSEIRIAFLDSLRGLAILMVFLFHAFSRWPEVVPYKSQFAEVPIFAFGWLGVQLFFLISGFVIFMTLEKSTGPGNFLKRRWLRLFPAMLICSLIVYATSPIFPFRPAGIMQPRDLLPGLTFIDPNWWRIILGSPQGLIEGAFWSLFVEVKFYILACSLYFLIGGKKLIYVLGAVFLMGHGFSRIPSIAGSPLGGELMSMRQFGWFAAGALFYRYFHEQKPFLIWAALGMSFAAAIAEGGRDMNTGAAGILIACLFASAVCFPFIQRVLSTKPLLLLGVASYPFYLIHENMSVSMIVQLGKAAPWIPSLALPLLPMGIVLTVAYIVAMHMEPSLRKAIRTAGRRIYLTFAPKLTS
jgi:peptidoglycan/LPS O-acetylase OafA/YrhL